MLGLPDGGRRGRRLYLQLPRVGVEYWARSGHQGLEVSLQTVDVVDD
jgi:hypothetical protein